MTFLRKSLIGLSAVLMSLAVRAETVDIDSAVVAKLAAEGIPVIDVRTVPEWNETGIIPGSHLVTFFDEKGQSNPDAWLSKVKGIAQSGSSVVIICRSGNRSKVVSQFLSQQAAFAKVYNAKDGILGWSQERRPLAPAGPALAACGKSKRC